MGMAAGMGIVLSPAASAQDAEDKIKEVLSVSPAPVASPCLCAHTPRALAALVPKIGPGACSERLSNVVSGELI